jgi:hypothetical protein
VIDHEQICCSLTSASLVKLAVFAANISMSNQFPFFYSGRVALRYIYTGKEQLKLCWIHAQAGLTLMVRSTR